MFTICTRKKEKKGLNFFFLFSSFFFPLSFGWAHDLANAVCCYAPVSGACHVPQIHILMDQLVRIIRFDEFFIWFSFFLLALMSLSYGRSELTRQDTWKRTFGSKIGAGGEVMWSIKRRTAASFIFKTIWKRKEGV